MKRKKEARKEMLNIPKICLAGIITIGIATVIWMLFQTYEKHPDSTEIIKNCLQKYQPICQEEIKMLSKEIDSIIKAKTSMGEPLTEEEKDAIVHAVCEELERATYCIPEQEMRETAYQIIGGYIGQELSEKTVHYQEEKAEPEKSTGNTAPVGQPNITWKDIQRIASSLDWTEEEIVNLIRENLSITDKTLEKTANALGISIHTLNRIIAENREYTDSLYLSIADALAIDASQLKALAEQAKSSSSDISYLSKKLKITEGKLNAEIAKSKALSSSEIEALAHKLQISAGDLEKLIWQHMELSENNIPQLTRQLSMDLESLYNQTDKSLSTLKEEMGTGIHRLEEANQTLTQNVEEASETAKTELEEAKNSLQGMIDNNQASITATSQALQEAKEKLGKGIENMQGNLADQKANADLKIGNIHNQISQIQRTMETYQWDTDASGTTRLTVTIPKEYEEDPS